MERVSWSWCWWREEMKGTVLETDLIQLSWGRLASWEVAASKELSS